MAAKDFALFVYAVLKDQKKTRGKTRLVRMLREQRPFKFFNIPAEFMKKFVAEAKGHGLLYVPIRNKKKPGQIELAVFADDAAKVQRIYDNLGLDFIKAEAGKATVEKERPASVSSKIETAHTENGVVEFEVGSLEDDFNISPVQQENSVNFTSGQEKESGGSAAERSLSAPSSPSKNSSPGLTSHDKTENKPSVKKELQEIKQEQAKKQAEKSKQPERQHPTHSHPKQKKRKKQKGR